MLVAQIVDRIFTYLASIIERLFGWFGFRGLLHNVMHQIYLFGRIETKLF